MGYDLSDHEEDQRSRIRVIVEKKGSVKEKTGPIGADVTALLKKARANQASMARETKSLLERKAKASAKLRENAFKTLREESEASDNAKREALAMHFILGGGQKELPSINMEVTNRGRIGDTQIRTIKHKVLAGIRIAQNPIQPVFIVSDMEVLIKQLKKMMIPYIEVRRDVLEFLSNNL